MATMTEQVEALIFWAQREADRTGRRQRVEAVPIPNKPGWYYQARQTARWAHSLIMATGMDGEGGIA